MCNDKKLFIIGKNCINNKKIINKNKYPKNIYINKCIFNMK